MHSMIARITGKLVEELMHGLGQDSDSGKNIGIHTDGKFVRFEDADFEQPVARRIRYVELTWDEEAKAFKLKFGRYGGGVDCFIYDTVSFVDNKIDLRALGQRLYRYLYVDSLKEMSWAS